MSDSSSFCRSCGEPIFSPDYGGDLDDYHSSDKTPAWPHCERLVAPENDKLEAAVGRIKQALLIEYPWQNHDCWSSEDESRAMSERGDDPWPHLQHVAEVAAQAALAEPSADDGELPEDPGWHCLLCDRYIGYGSSYAVVVNGVKGSMCSDCHYRGNHG